MESIVLSNGNVTEEEFQRACKRFSSFSGIIEASAFSSYERFLQITLGYIRSECASGKSSDFELRKAIEQIAGVINRAEIIDMRGASSEIADINQVLATKLSQTGYENVLNDNLEAVLNIDYCNDLYDYYRNGLPSTKYLEKTLIYYVLAEEDIAHKSTYKVEDFVEYLVAKLMKKKLVINLTVSSLMKHLEDMFNDEIEAYKSSKSSNQSRKYPSLFKSLLLNGIRENILKLIREYENEPKFVECLNYLLFTLSDYDVRFLKNIKISVPIEELKYKVTKALCELFSTKAQVCIALYRKESIRKAASELYDEKISTVNITPGELIKQLPSDFIPNMINSYNDSGDDENPYAKRLSAAIAKCCFSGEEATQDLESIQEYLNKTYGQSSEKVSGF